MLTLGQATVVSIAPGWIGDGGDQTQEFYLSQHRFLLGTNPCSLCEEEQVYQLPV